MKLNFLLLAAAIMFCSTLFGQTDTGKIYHAQFLKKGFYKSYNEFIQNSPSIRDEFTIIPVYAKKDTTTILAGKYQLKDTLIELSHIWGFCDGTNVYVNSSPSYFYNYYWKLQSIGRYSCFKGGSGKKGFPLPLPGLILPMAGFAARQIINFTPKNLSVFIITENGKFKEPGIGYMKKLLAEQPDLLEAFKKKADKYQKFDNANTDEFESEEDYETKLSIIIEYLSKLNEAMRKNTGH